MADYEIIALNESTPQAVAPTSSDRGVIFDLHVKSTFSLGDTSDDHQYTFAVNELAANRSIALPLLLANDTFLFEAHGATLTNKIINGLNNTITNVSLATGVTGQLPITSLSITGTPDGTKFLRDDGTWQPVSGSGDLVGPASSTNNALMRYDGTTGKLAQNSTGTLSDGGVLTVSSLVLTTDLPLTHGGTAASDAAGARTKQGVDAAGTDNSTNVTLAGSLDYLTLSGQEITRNAIVLTTDVSGILPIANIATGTPDGTKYVRDDGTLVTPPTGGVDTSGTPILNDFAKFTDADTLVGRSYTETLSDLSLSANLQSLTIPASTTISTFMATVLDDTDSAAARTTLDAQRDLNGLTLSDAGTPASNYKVLIQDTSDSDNVKYVAASEFLGGGGDVVDDTTPQLGGSLDVNGNAIVSVSDTDIAITPNGTGDLVLDGLNWPQADGTSAQVLSTDGAGQLSWITPSGSGDVVGPGSATDNAITRYNGASGTSIQNSTVLIDDSGRLTLPGATTPSYAAGVFFYNSDIEAFSYFNDESDVRVDIGREIVLRVRNASGSTITKGTVVYDAGTYHSGSDSPQVDLADASALATAQVKGIATHDIENNSTGYVVTTGRLEDFDTSAFSVGDEVWLSETAGEMTATRPSQPAFTSPVGMITRSHASQGHMSVNAQGVKFGAYTTGKIAFGGSDGFLKEDADLSFSSDNLSIPAGGQYQIGGTDIFSGRALTIEATANVALVNGNLCFMNSDPEMALTDADAVGTMAGMLAMCTETIAENATGTFVTHGVYTTSGLTAGATYYASTTPGAITSTAPSGSGDYVRVVGYALSTTQLYFNPGPLVGVA